MGRLVAALFLAGLSVVLIGVYLAPDDLARCQTGPVVSDATDHCQPADAIIAVSGGDTMARTKEAVKLYRAGWAPLLVFSGAAADKTGPSNARAMQDYALELGVPSSAILVEEASETTHQNAKLSHGVLANNKLSRVILVTSGYHQRRASIEFRNAAGSEIAIHNHPVASDNQWSSWWWLTPNGWWLALSELVKIILVYIGVSR
jgi:uncharacterized SAM-binding protein YcdF (DUF218 family)